MPPVQRRRTGADQVEDREGEGLQAKDKIPGLKVLRQDYLIEAVSVPLAEVQIEEGRNADNSALAQRITKETQQIAP